MAIIRMEELELSPIRWIMSIRVITIGLPLDYIIKVVAVDIGLEWWLVIMEHIDLVLGQQT